MNISTRVLAIDEPRRYRALNRVLRHAHRHLPLYRDAWSETAAPGMRLPVIRQPEEMRQFPLVSREDLAATPLDQRRDARWPSRLIGFERSGGSTGMPLVIPVDALSLWRRQWRFLRGLRECGYRFGDRMMFLSTRVTGPHPTMPGVFCVDLRAATATMVRLYHQLRPRVVYGPLNSLVLLADALAAAPRRHCPELIVSTAEAMSTGQRADMADVFGTDPADFYGSSEAGLIAWRRPGQDTYQFPGRDFLVELLPTPADALYRLVLTDLRAGGCSPLVRYDTGDVVEIDAAAGAVARIHGRLVDCLTRRDGVLVSPYRVTLVLEGMPWIARYQVVQRADLSVDLALWGQGVAEPERQARVLAALRTVVGAGVHIRVRAETGRAAGDQRKFRPVRSEVAIHAYSDALL